MKSVIGCVVVLVGLSVSGFAQADTARRGTDRSVSGAAVGELDARSDSGPRGSVGGGDVPSAVPTTAGVVNLNEATEEQLGYLPRIGPSRARAIVQLRQKMGRFRALTDIIRVRGIGPATYRQLKPFIALDGPTTYRP